jgi:hypothetical protein
MKGILAAAFMLFCAPGWVIAQKESLAEFRVKGPLTFDYQLVELFHNLEARAKLPGCNDAVLIRQLISGLAGQMAFTGQEGKLQCHTYPFWLEPEERAVAAIQAGGLRLREPQSWYPDRELETVQLLDLQMLAAGQDCSALIARCPHLEVLAVRQDCIATLAVLPAKLKHLTLLDAEIDLRLWDLLCSAPQLQSLFMGGCTSTPEFGEGHARSLLVRELTLSCCSLGSDLWDKKWPELEHLSFNDAGSFWFFNPSFSECLPKLRVLHLESGALQRQLNTYGLKPPIKNRLRTILQPSPKELRLSGDLENVLTDQK